MSSSDEIAVKQSQGDITKQFWRFLWSSILIALSGCLGNVVDGIIVGNLIGEDGVSAINLSRPVVQFMFTVTTLIATGASMVVGFYLGKKDAGRARYVFTQALFGSLAVGLVLTAIALLWPAETAALLCKNARLLQPTREYLSVLLLGAPAYLMMWALSAMVGVDGSPRLVSVAILIDNAVNLCLDIVFIKYFGWGIAGSSAATVVGHIVGFAIMLRHFGYSNCNLKLSWSSGDTWGKAWRQIISQGTPLALASICLTLLLFCANSIVLSARARTGIFVFALCMNLLQIYNLFLAGTCRTLQSLGSIEVGRGDVDNLRLVIGKCLRFITVAMVVTCIFVWVWPQGIAELFGCKDTATLAESNHALRVFALSFIPFCYIYVLMIIYKLYGYHRMALFISLALSLTVIPVLWAVAHIAPQAIWYSYLIAYVIEGAIIYLLHRLQRIRFTLQRTTNE
ncbi:MAG: hypothetical protein J6X70_07470 [Muribaculaceae bacterium]|nr:hypothetical protein [Muribaculaceae bacterium]